MSAADADADADWDEVTHSLVDCTAKCLNHAQVLMTTHFSLLQAMTSIEIMHPKMDSGIFIKSSQSTRIIPHSNLQLLSVFNQLLALEAAWLQGQLLTQTIFTCIYMHESFILATPDGYLKSFVLATLYSTYKIIQLTSRSPFVDEEDLSLETFGYPLYVGYNYKQVLDFIEENLLELDMCLKMATLEIDDDALHEKEAIQSLIHHFEFRFVLSYYSS